jgi:murein DD-endopeptidase MepM/ murein hydrolase activator NlpD
MSSFDLEIASSFTEPGEMTGGLGGPGGGTHASGEWYIHFGNDLGARAGTPVRAICDGHITALDVTHASPQQFTSKIYGAGVFIQATNAVLVAGAPGGVGMYYTHIDVAPGIALGADVVRGQLIGHVVENAPTAPHLHFAIAERRGGTNFGVNIYELLKTMANQPGTRTLTFFQDGRPPQESAGTPTPPPTTPPPTTPPPTTPPPTTPPPTTPPPTTPPPTTPPPTTPPPTTPPPTPSPTGTPTPTPTPFP